MTQVDVCSIIAACYNQLQDLGRNIPKTTHQIQANELLIVQRTHQLQYALKELRDGIRKGLYGCYDNTFFDASKIYHVYEDRGEIEINRVNDTVNIHLDFAYDPIGRINVTISGIGKDVTNLPGNVDIRLVDGLPYVASQQWTSKSLDGREIGLFIQNFVTAGEMQQQLG